MSDSEKQVSEVSGMGEQPEEISPEDAVAGAPDGESGAVQEGTAGPDAPPHDGRPGRDSQQHRDDD